MKKGLSSLGVSVGTSYWQAFDKLQKQHEDTAFKTLKQAAYLTWLVARRSLKYRKDTSTHSPPGQPPYRHRKYGQFGIHTILFNPEKKSEFNKHDMAAVVGPKMDNNFRGGSNPIPNIIEYGGMTKENRVSDSFSATIRRAAAGKSNRAVRRIKQRLKKDPGYYWKILKEAKKNPPQASRRIKARPFMTPARDKIAPQLPGIYQAVAAKDWPKFKKEFIDKEKESARKARLDAKMKSKRNKR